MSAVDRSTNTHTNGNSLNVRLRQDELLWVTWDVQHRSNVWPGGLMVRALDALLKGRGFNSRPFRFQVTTLGKLFTHVPLSPSSINWHCGGDAMRLGR